MITTNGTLITEDLAKRLRKKKLALIQISLDGFRPQTHDKLRGIEGTYQKVMTAIGSLKGKVPIQINTTIMSSNLDEILDLYDFTCKNKMKISFQGLVNLGNNEEKVDFQKNHYLFPKDSKKVAYVVDELLRKKKHNDVIVNSYSQLMRLKLYYCYLPQLKKKSCEIIANHLWIRQDGNLLLCTFCEPIGNLAKNSLRSIWKSEKTAQTFREMRQCKIVSCLIFRGCHKESYSEIFSKVKRVFCGS